MIRILLFDYKIKKKKLKKSPFIFFSTKFAQQNPIESYGKQ